MLPISILLYYFFKVVSLSCCYGLSTNHGKMNSCYFDNDDFVLLYIELFLYVV